MTMSWRSFYRTASPSHRLEAKKADGGETYGHSNQNLIAEEGQWLCRNPENGHTWAMSGEGMVEFYKPTVNDDQEWNDLIAKTAPKKKRKKGSAEEATKHASSSFDPHEAGPLFFGDEDEEEGMEE